MKYAYSPPVDGYGGNEVLLALHGTGGDETSLFDLATKIANGKPVLCPRGDVLESGVWPRFFRRIAEGLYDYDDVAARIDRFAEWLPATLATHGLPSQTVISAFGYSNGANFIAAALLRHPGLIRNAFMVRPAMVMPEKFLAGKHAVSLPSSMGRATLVIGGRDPICPPELGVATAELIRAGGAYEVAVHKLEHSGHEWTATDGQLLGLWSTSP